MILEGFRKDLLDLAFGDAAEFHEEGQQDVLAWLYVLVQAVIAVG